MLKKIVAFLIKLLKKIFDSIPDEGIVIKPELTPEPENPTEQPTQPEPQPEPETQPEPEVVPETPVEPEIKEMTNADYVEHFHQHLSVMDTGINYLNVPPMGEMWLATDVSFAYDGPYKIKHITVELAYYKFEDTMFGLQAILLQDLSTYKVGIEATANGVDDVLNFVGFDNPEAQLAAVDVLTIELEDGTIVDFTC